MHRTALEIKKKLLSIGDKVGRSVISLFSCLTFKFYTIWCYLFTKVTLFFKPNIGYE